MKVSPPPMEKLTPKDLINVLLQLQASELSAIVVGGQAVNLWAYKYQAQCPELREFMPYTSEDLDFYGGRVEAVVCHEVLGGQVRLNQDFDPSPNAGVVLVDRPDGQLRIDFLATVYGLSEAEIVGTAQRFTDDANLPGLSMQVLHPILCLEGKMSCLRGLPQFGRQDLRHAWMSALCVHQFLKDQCAQGESRPVLKLIERVLRAGLREDGLNVWQRHGLYLESVVPIEEIQQLPNESWRNFYTIRLPQILQQLATKRQRYLAMKQKYQPELSEGDPDRQLIRYPHLLARDGRQQQRQDPPQMRP